MTGPLLFCGALALYAFFMFAVWFIRAGSSPIAPPFPKWDVFLPLGVAAFVGLAAFFAWLSCH